MRREKHLTGESIAEVFFLTGGEASGEAMVIEQVAQFMESRKPATLYMQLFAIEYEDEVLVVDDSADALETCRGLCADDFDAMGFEYILDVADGIEAQLPVLADS